VYLPVIVGVTALVAFVAIQLRSPRPMVELSLFANRIFLWGTVGAVFVSLALVGLLFLVPQYLQVVLGYGTLATGVRLIPLIAGLMVGGLAADRLVARLGFRTVVTTGLLVLATGFGLGALTGTGDGFGQAVRWLVVIGLGIGLTLPPIMDAVLGTVPERSAGAGSGLLQALRQVGGAFGVAVLGSLLSWAYADRLDVTQLPAQAAKVAEESVAGAATVAQRLGDGELLSSAQAAFVHAMSIVMLVCALGAVLIAMLIARFLPGRARPEIVPSQNEDHELSGVA
jgi:Na+/melibiose symporter-like transporter